jgi:hypothetical protein
MKGHDVLVQRLVTKEDGENVKITVRMEDGQFIKTASFGDGDVAEKEAVTVYEAYGKTEAESFVSELEKLIIENDGKKEGDKED